MNPEVMHKHIIIRAEVNNPPMNNNWWERLTNKAQREMNAWLKQLISDIHMKVMFGPRSMYCPVIGNRGMTSFAIIETSHIALHSWDEGNGVIQFDVYTCSDLDKETVFAALQRFEPTKIQWKFLDRHSDLIDVTQE